MHLQGNFSVKSPRVRVWEFVSSPEQIAQCLPDLQKLEVLDSAHFSVTVKVGIAFVRGSFKFNFTLLDQNPPSHSEFEALGKGAGVSVRLKAHIDLTEVQADLTDLSWDSDVQLGGLLSEISSGLVQGSTDKFTHEFFACIKTRLEQE